MELPENLKYTSSHEWIADNRDGTVSGWAPVVRGDGGWMLVNLRHVVRIETGSEDGPHVGFG